MANPHLSAHGRRTTIGQLDVTLDAAGHPHPKLNVVGLSGYGAIFLLPRSLRLRLQAQEAVETVLGCAFTADHDRPSKFNFHVVTRLTGDTVEVRYALPDGRPTEPTAIPVSALR